MSTSLPAPPQPCQAPRGAAHWGSPAVQVPAGEEGEVVQLQAGAAPHLRDPAAIQTEAVLVL